MGTLENVPSTGTTDTGPARPRCPKCLLAVWMSAGLDIWTKEVDGSPEEIA